MTTNDYESLYASDLSAAIDHMRAARFNVDGNLERIHPGASEPSHESRVDLVLRLRGYAPRRDLAEALAKALISVWGPENAAFLVEQVRREKAADTRTAAA